MNCRSVLSGLYFPWAVLSIMVIAGVGLTPIAAVADTLDPVTRALSGRHEEPSPRVLEDLAGGQDALIEKLIELRINEDLPFVAIRAERLLLRYADRGNVAALLEQDLGSVKYKGLAQVIALNIDLVPSGEARSRLANAALKRSVQEESFLPYARALRDSKDADVSRLARERLQ